MKRVLLVLASMLALSSPASSQTILRCRTSGGAAVDCASPIQLSYVPTLTSAKLPIIPLTLGGFGQSLAGLLTTPTELQYVHGVSGPIQAQLDAIAAALVTPTSGSGNLATDFVSLTPGAAFANVGLPLSLPSAGTYLITGEVAGYLSTGGVPPFGEETLSIRLRNTTAGTAIVHSERVALKLFDSTAESFLAPMSVLVTVAGPSTIDLQAAADPGAGTIAAAYITSPGSTLGAGWFTQLSFIKVSN